MEKEIKQASFDVEVELISGRDGIFDVRVDDELIFSKKCLSRFPKHNEISQILISLQKD